MKRKGQIYFFNVAREYLLSFEEVSDGMIDLHLNDWKRKRPKTIPDLYREFLYHAKNKQGMKNSIGDLSDYSRVLCNFNPKKILKKYDGWKNVFDAIKNGKIKPPGRMVKSNKSNYWVVYSKTILSVAKFLSEFQTMKEYSMFVKRFYTNELSRLALPLLIKAEIYGFGFALACDLLKETGYPYFVKPDVHIKDICKALGITNGKSDYQIFKDLEAYSNQIGKLPYEVDKIFWLVGSGNFYRNKIKIKTSKSEFIKKVRKQQRLR